MALYHGAFSPGRGLEVLAEALLDPGLEGVHAAYLGYGSHLGRLEQMAADLRFGGRLHVLQAVPPEELVGWVSGADVEVMMLEPVASLNNAVARCEAEPSPEVPALTLPGFFFA